MNKKWPLFAGLLLLTTGILLKIITELLIFSTFLIILGVLFKTTYIFQRIKYGNYNPGIEIIILITGLILFFAGVYFKDNHNSMKYMFLMVPGIILKVIFTVLFIKKNIKK